jgi:hypothetical protein
MYRMATLSDCPIAQAVSSGIASGTAVSDDDNDGDGAPFDPNVGTELAGLTVPGTGSSDDAVAPEIVAFAQTRYFGPSQAPGGAIRSRLSTGGADRVARDQSWRRIDHDWLGVSADLAMQLDDRTNNTSLVLAFELTDTDASCCSRPTRRSAIGSVGRRRGGKSTAIRLPALISWRARFITRWGTMAAKTQR